MKTKIAITLDESLLIELDKYRGTFNISAYINDVLTQWVELKKSEEVT